MTTSGPSFDRTLDKGWSQFKDLNFTATQCDPNDVNHEDEVLFEAMYYPAVDCEGILNKDLLEYATLVSNITHLNDEIKETSKAIACLNSLFINENIKSTFKLTLEQNISVPLKYSVPLSKIDGRIVREIVGGLVKPEVLKQLKQLAKLASLVDGLDALYNKVVGKQWSKETPTSSDTGACPKRTGPK